jgi:hypothetical protein
VRYIAFGLLVAWTVAVPDDKDRNFVTLAQRRQAIARAQVWQPTNIPSMNVRIGPDGEDAFAPDQIVSCNFVNKKLDGKSPKFACALPDGDELKVKYGQGNGEVYATVAASRLLWALGFGADRIYPVKVVCRGCSIDPRDPAQRPEKDAVAFGFAVVERKMPGHEIETRHGSGWSWPELDMVREDEGGAPRTHRDALKLLAVFLQHTDSKPEQQRLLCLSGKPVEGAVPCARPLMMLHDVGLTFGQANVYNRNSPGSTNFKEWRDAPVWKDKAKCIGDLPKSQSGTLEHPQISEAGRQFLAGLLTQLTDAQLKDLFEVARFPERTINNEKNGGSVNEWIDVFHHKVAEVTNTRCPS